MPRFVAVLAGIIVGSILFSLRVPELTGGIIGGVAAYLLVTVFRQQAKLFSLEKKITLTAGQSVSRAPGPAAPVPPPKQAPVQASSKALPTLEISEDTGADITPVPKPAPASKAARVSRPGPGPAGSAATGMPGDKIEWLDIITSYFTGGNVVVRVGVIVLFFGVGFLLKYSIENNLVPIELRLAGICLGGIAMLIIGWRLRIGKTTYALILQGGGVGILYLTIFSALKLYNLIPAGLALALLIALPVFSGALAIIQNARSLVVIGIIGGFLAPVLTSTGSGSHIVLFSYYTLLNGGILFVARFKSWRELNLIGFIFTFVIGALWGTRSFQPELFSTTEPFLILFFCFYVALGVLFAGNQPLKRKGYIDCTMVFGTPIVCFALQTALVKPYEYGIAWSALGMGSVYACLAWLLFRKGTPAMRTLIESFLALGVVFGTIAIPLALDGRWTAAAWALEGSAVIWIAIRQNREIARIFGGFLQLLAGLAFLSEVGGSTGDTVVLNGFYLGCLAVAAGGFLSSFLLNGARVINTAVLESRLLLGWALVWWFGSGLHEIDTFVPHDNKPAVVLAFWAFSSLLSLLAAQKLSWSDLRHVYKSLLPVMIATSFYWLSRFHWRPSIHLGIFLWPVAMAVHYHLMYLDRKQSEKQFLALWHPASFILPVFLISWEAWWWTDHFLTGPGVWSLVTLALVPAFFVMILSRFKDSLPWPISLYHRTYLYHALAPLILYLLTGSVLVNLFSKGNPWPLPYLPFFNPLDLTQIMVSIVVLYWFLVLQMQMDIQPFTVCKKELIIGSVAFLFFWLNTVLIRTLHFWGEVPFSARGIMRSDLTQTSLSIFWTLSALTIMKWASANNRRRVWMLGAGLVGIVVTKLFTLDLAHTGTVERIVSFLGVGIICLVIGYLAPLPNEQEVPSA